MAINGNMVSLQLISFLFLFIVPAYFDLPHTALQRVPAKLGEDAVIRCTKILRERASYRKGYHHRLTKYAFCYPSGEKNCTHAWSKDGILLDNPEKYETNSSITYNYCENFNQSSKLKNGFEISSGYGTEMRCLSSALKIKNVTEADFGYYSCNFSDHTDSKPSPEDRDDIGKKYQVLNITLFNVDDTAIEQPKEVQYFESFHPDELKDKILAQCVAIGGKLQWFVSPGNCFEKNCSFVPLQETGSQDFWQSFNFSEKRHMPYPNVTESFLYFDNIQVFDYVNLTCNVGDIMDNKYSNGVAKIKIYDEGFYSEYTFHVHIIVNGVIISIIIAILLISFIIVASVRVKLCMCCQVTENSPILQYQLQSQPPSHCS